MFCSLCGAANATAAKYCERCWSSLADPIVDPVEAEQLRRSYRHAKLRRRLIRSSLVALALAFLAWYSLNLVLSSPVPQPSGLSQAIVGPSAWALPGRDLAGTSRVDEPLRLEGEVLWRHDTSGAHGASLAVARGVVYLAADRRVLALDAETGVQIWGRDIANPASAPPVVTTEALYVGLRDGQLLALRRETGELRWSRAFDGSVSTAPVVREGVLYLGLSTGRMVALDAQTGHDLWRYETGSWIGAAPIFADNVMALLSQNGDVHFLDVVTGELRMDYGIGQLTQSSPAFVNATFVATSDRGHVVALDAEKVEYPLEDWLRALRTQVYLWGLQGSRPTPKGELWRRSVEDGSGFRSPAVADGSVYVVSENGTLFSIEAVSGDVLWEHQSNAPVDAGPVVAGDKVYIATRTGQVLEIERGSGLLAAEFSVAPGLTELVIADGAVFLLTADGMLYAVR